MTLINHASALVVRGAMNSSQSTELWSSPQRAHGGPGQWQRAQELVDFKVFTEGAGEGSATVKIIGPGGIITPTTSRNIDPYTIEYKYTPERDGRYRVMITWAGKEIQRSPFEVNVSPLKSSKIKAFGPGLQGECFYIWISHSYNVSRRRRHQRRLGGLKVVLNKIMMTTLI